MYIQLLIPRSSATAYTTTASFTVITTVNTVDSTIYKYLKVSINIYILPILVGMG